MFRFLSVFAGLLLLAGCLDKSPDLSIGEAYSFATQARNGAAFLTIENDGGADRLIAAESDVAGTLEIHETTMDGGRMTMRKVEALDIPAGGSATLAPQGHHIMLIGLNRALVEGETFDLTLRFETSGEMTFPVMIGAPGQKPDMTHQHDHDHDHEHGHEHGQGHAEDAQADDGHAYHHH